MKKSNAQFSSLFAESVTVITAKLGDRENAMPATWCIPVSFNPPMLAVSISPERFTHDMVKESKKFGVCLLSEQQAELSRKLGSASGRDTNKLKGLDIFYGDMGVPLIEGCVACMECSVSDEAREGDHTVFTGEVKSLYTSDKKPLLLFKGGYMKSVQSLGGY
jgi:flavin reductase (DIM6/NTAB) family NADH-FMN oxidoreductase RutF